MFFSNKTLKIFLLGLILILPFFAVARAVWSATSSTGGTATISVNYPAPTNTGGGGGDTVPPAAVTNLSVATVSTTTITLQWTAPGDNGNDGLANRYIVRYTTSGAIVSDAAWNSAATASAPPAPQMAGATQTMVVGGLNPDTTYYFALKTADAASNWSGLSNSPSGKTLLVPDTAAPVIEKINVIIGQPDVWPGLRAVNIGWEVTEASGAVSSTVHLGKTAGYELEAKSQFYSGGTGFGFNFIYTGLDINTTYHFKITAVDGSGNQAETTDQTFIINWDDTPPIISNVSAQPGINYATITWITDEPADSQVAYGPTTSLGAIVSSPILLAAHSLDIPNLLPNTKYYYAARSADGNGNQASGEILNFTTLKDAAPPANVGAFRAVAGDGQINLYWENPSDPDFAGVVIQRSSVEQPRDTSQGARVYRGGGSSLNDLGLTNGTTYYYTAFSYDTSGNFSSGALSSAVPESGAPPPPPPPPPPGCVGDACLPPPPPPGCVGEFCEIIITTTSTISGFTLSEVDFFTARRSLKLAPQDNRVRILVGQDLTASIKPQVFVKEFSDLILKIGEAAYQLVLDRFGNYSADIMMPAQPFDYPASISFKYKDNDGRVENLFFAVSVLPGGLVYTIIDGQRQLVAGATVELYFLNAFSQWELWNASGYHQSNPQITGMGGSYGFAAPPGVYFLRASKDGFRTTETSRFELTTFIVNNLIELLAVPPPLKAVIESEVPLIENVGNVAKNLGQKTVFVSKIAAQEVIKFTANPEVKKVTKEVAAPAVAVATAVGTTATVGASQFLLYLRFLFTQPILVFFRRRRKGWGLVYNSLTKQPVDLVIVRLVDAQTRRIVQSRVTDKEGRYSFIAVPGQYRIEINQPQFEFPTRFLSELKDDGAFVDIYHGEVIEVKEKGALLTANIPLDPVGVERPVGRILRQLILRRLQSSLAIISIVLSAVFVIIAPGILTGSLLAAQVVFYAIFRHLAVPPKPKSWGIVYDEKTKNPVGAAVARIFDRQYNKLLETQITDKRGRYSFLVGRNEYYITYEKNGYEKSQTEPIDLKTHPEPSTVLAPDAKLKPIDQEPRTK